MLNLAAGNRATVKDLFAGVPIWKAFIHSALEDGYGLIKADDEHNPQMAVLFYGGLVIYAGKHDSPLSLDLIREFPVQPLVLAYAEGWNANIRKVFGEKAKTIRRYYLPFQAHDRSTVEEIIRQNRHPVRRVSPEDFGGLKEALGWEHQLYHYRNPEDFLQNGCGHIVEEGGAIAAGASAFCQSRRYCECQVNTSESFKQRGLGTCVAAACINDCYAREKEIPWDAANEVSVKLGQRLGYREVQAYLAFECFP